MRKRSVLPRGDWARTGVRRKGTGCLHRQVFGGGSGASGAMGRLQAGRLEGLGITDANHPRANADGYREKRPIFV